MVKNWGGEKDLTQTSFQKSWKAARLVKISVKSLFLKRAEDGRWPAEADRIPRAASWVLALESRNTPKRGAVPTNGKALGMQSSFLLPLFSPVLKSELEVDENSVARRYWEVVSMYETP